MSPDHDPTRAVGASDPGNRRRIRLLPYFWSLFWAGRRTEVDRWDGADRDERRRVSRWATLASAVAIVGGNTVIGIETFLLIHLAFNGGQINLDGAAGTTDLAAAVVAVVCGMIVNVVVGLILIWPHLRWFIDDSPDGPARQRAVARIPIQQVFAALCGWAVVLGVFLLMVDDLDWALAAGLVGACALAAVTSSCLTYVFAERAVRPLAVIALRGSYSSGVLHGVSERLLAIWVVSSAVPMVGLLVINLGRWAGWLPGVAGAVEWTTVVLAVVGLVSGSRVVALLGRAIVDPLADISATIKQVTEGDFDAEGPVYDSSELGYLQHGVNRMVAGLRERERMREIFGRHVGDHVAELALEQGDDISGVNTDVAVIFVDITGSTSFAARRDPQETAVVLNAFFSIVADTIADHGGFINKFEGDAALVIFGAPVPMDDPAATALAAARDLGRRLGETLPLEWGLGVSYGRVFAGRIGAQTRYEYTVIGDAVNAAARLSELAKTEGSSPILASGEALDAADTSDDPAGEGECANWRQVDHTVLRGRPEPTLIYAPADLMTRQRPPSLSSVIANLVRLPQAVITRRDPRAEVRTGRVAAPGPTGRSTNPKPKPSGRR